MDYELTRVTHQLLDRLGVAHHQAPGEAEAECARLQALGVVDAVWSDDGDALMFGCTTLINQHKVGKDRIKDQIRVYKAEAILEKHGLDRDGLVLFAILSGGDYKTEGLKNCGPKTAALLAKQGVGLASQLRHASQQDLPAWRAMLNETLTRYGKWVEIPQDFPNFKALGHYRGPTISSPEQLHNLRGLKHGWDRRIDQVKLRVMLRQRFNFTTREFLKHIVPVFLTRALARATPEQKEENLPLSMQLKRTRKRKEDDETPEKAEVKITFSPIPLVEVDLRQQPPDEDWSVLAGKDGNPYDPTQKVECEILTCFVEHGLPNGLHDVSPVPLIKRKRKSTDEDTEVSPPPKKQRSQSASEQSMNRSQDVMQDVLSNNPSIQPSAPPKQRGKQRNSEVSKASNGDSKASKLRQSKREKDPPAPPASPPPPIFKPPRAIPPWMTDVVDLATEGSNSEADDGIDRTAVSNLDIQPVDSALPQYNQAPTASQAMAPGEPISREALRALRSSSMLPRPTAEAKNSAAPQSTLECSLSRPIKSKISEVIDLT